jgi:hypothetical protein
MRVTREGGYVSIHDRAAPFWALGLFLLAGGIIAVAMPLGLATNTSELEPWQRVASVVVGLGVSAGALWWLRQNPATHVKLDLTRRHARLVRSGLTGREERRFAFEEVQSVEVEQGTDDEGGTVWRPAIRLRTGEMVLLSQLWSHDRAGVKRGAEAVAEACRLM